MAGIQLKPTSRLAASSIMEVIVAMVLIVVVFGIAMQIFANVMRLSLTAKKIKAQAVLNEVLIKTKQFPDLGKSTSVVEEYTIDQETKTYNNNNDLVQINLTAYDNNQEKVAELNQVIYVTQ